MFYSARQLLDTTRVGRIIRNLVWDTTTYPNDSKVLLLPCALPSYLPTYLGTFLGTFPPCLCVRYIFFAKHNAHESKFCSSIPPIYFTFAYLLLG